MQSFIKVGILLVSILMGSFVVAAPKTQVEGNFNISLYENIQGQVSEFELFTKIPERDVYLGITCTDMSPFPLIQVLLFNDEVLADLPKLLSINYSISPKNTAKTAIMLQGVLKPIDTVDEHSNQIRLELVSGQVKNMWTMAERYQQLLQVLKQGASVTLTLSHRTFEDKTYHFSLQGLKTLIQPHESICS